MFQHILKFCQFHLLMTEMHCISNMVGLQAVGCRHQGEVIETHFIMCEVSGIEMKSSLLIDNY